MKALILNGAAMIDPMGERIYKALKERLTIRGWQVEHIQLHEKKIPKSSCI